MVSYTCNVDSSQDLRQILAQNIRTIRRSLHISQAKLAEHADISLSYLNNIERCETWVSDKTLKNLARTLNKEAWELLSPSVEESSLTQGRKPSDDKRRNMQRIADLVVKKREFLRHTVNQTMEDLIIEISKEE